MLQDQVVCDQDAIDEDVDEVCLIEYRGEV